METETQLFEGYEPPPVVEPEPAWPTLGAPVTFTRHLRRRYRHDPQSRGNVGIKEWISEGWPGQPEPAQRQGLVIGVRHLANGENHYHGYEEGIEFRATDRLTAYLVVFDMRRKPVLVLPEHLAPRDA